MDGPDPSTDSVIPVPGGASSFDPASSSRPGDSRAGDSIGAYRLLERIGEGGFGEVWCAEQREPITRRVALKLIKPGMDSKAVIARFEQERQALALMDHPGIAKVLDAGTTPSGRLYFVMELVRGEPITRYCSRARLPIADRLELFARVCDAVQHAHMKGIIHRDLKPGNILVTVPEGERPRPVVIDFGVAKAVASRLTDHTVFTLQGQEIGTPEYMSPEQAEMIETDIDTRTDVFSLGALLYELLTGLLPLDSDALRSRGFAEAQRVIREVDPPRPSTRLSGSAQAGPPGHAAPGDLRTLARQLRGELDWVVMKCLEKDRTRRYDSASALAAEIRRFLASEPVLARPPSTAYQVRKFVQRRTGLVASCAAMLALLLGGLGVSLWQAGVARAQRDRALGAEAEATRERNRAVAVTDFVVGALQSQDPTESGREGITVADAMKGAVRAVDAGALSHDPATVATLLDTIATILNRNARSAEAEPLAERALRAARELHAGDPPDVARRLTTLSEVRRSLGRSGEALELCREAVAMNQRLHAGDDADTAASLVELATTLRELGRFADAAPPALRALEMYRRLHPGDHPNVAASLGQIAAVLERSGRAADAEPLLVEALEMNRRIHRGDHPAVASSLFSLAFALETLGREAEAEPLLVQALEMQRRIRSGDHPQTANALNSLAGVRLTLGRAAEAEVLFQESLDMRRRLYPGDHPSVAESLSNVAFARQRQGRITETEPLLLEALEMQRRIFGGDHPDLATALNNLAVIRESLGRAGDAEPLFLEALEMRRRIYRGDHPAVALVMAKLAACRESLGKHGLALPLAEEADAMARRCLPEHHVTRDIVCSIAEDIRRASH